MRWRWAIGALAAVATLAFGTSAGAAGAGDVDGGLRDFLRGYLGPPERWSIPAAPTRYAVAWVDLKHDGGREALVYVSGADWCGTGGCTLLVLEPTANTFKVIGDVSVVRLPIGVLQSTSHGWRDIAVGVGGGGIINGYTAVLSFGGRGYPDNPTVRPARRLRSRAKATVVIDSTTKATALF